MRVWECSLERRFDSKNLMKLFQNLFRVFKWGRTRIWTHAPTYKSHWNGSYRFLWSCLSKWGKGSLFKNAETKILFFRFLVKVNIYLFCLFWISLSLEISFLPWRNCFFPFQICDMKWCHGQYTYMFTLVCIDVKIFHNLRTRFPSPEPLFWGVGNLGLGN